VLYNLYADAGSMALKTVPYNMNARAIKSMLLSIAAKAITINSNIT
jgi:hypothetical protein